MQARPWPTFRVRLAAQSRTSPPRSSTRLTPRPPLAALRPAVCNFSATALAGRREDWFDDHRDEARAVGAFYSDRYGGGQEILDTIREDPFGALLDAGGIAAGGAGLAVRAPGAAGRVARAVVQSDPTGRVINAAGKAVKDRLPRTPGAKEFIAAAPGPEQLRAQGSNLFEQAEKSGVQFKGNYYDKFVDTALARMVDEGADPILSPKISRIADVLEMTKGSTPSIAQMAIVRKQFGNAAGSADRAEARLGSIGVDLVDDFVEGGASNIGGSLKEARAFWSRLRKSEVIDAAIENASAGASRRRGGIAKSVSRAVAGARFKENERLLRCRNSRDQGRRARGYDR